MRHLAATLTFLALATSGQAAPITDATWDTVSCDGFIRSPDTFCSSYRSEERFKNKPEINFSVDEFGNVTTSKETIEEYLIKEGTSFEEWNPWFGSMTSFSRDVNGRTVTYSGYRQEGDDWYVWGGTRGKETEFQIRRASSWQIVGNELIRDGNWTTNDIITTFWTGWEKKYRGNELLWENSWSTGSGSLTPLNGTWSEVIPLYVPSDVETVSQTPEVGTMFTAAAGLIAASVLMRRRAVCGI